MKKSAQVVMLPTNEKANIWLDNFGTGLYNCPTGATGVIYQHLYILSDEKIKEGDWFVGFADGSIKPFVKQADESTVEINNWQLNKKGHSSNKKIIATTDNTVKFPERFPSFVTLPQIPQSFIEKFVEEYNKGNVITEVMVEYENIDMDFDPTEQNGIKWQTILKINSDNTINISMPKDSWSREEVIELIQKYSKECTGWSCFETDEKWIEENL